MTDQSTPVKLNLKKDEKLEIEWRDGRRSTYPIAYLRSMCPCASCKAVRGGYEGHPPAIGAVPPPEQHPKRTSLTILPGNYAQPLSAVKAELVGNYALRIDWSDNHGSGIYSFEYLREIDPTASADSSKS
jgi:DUF971 family protein